VRWETDFGAASLSHVNLYDRTVEGLELLEVPGGTVQYHPEAGPGPHDSLYLFDRFLQRIGEAHRTRSRGRLSAAPSKSSEPEPSNAAA
jgi:carbamoyl-phosphate synthase small subunit